MFIVKIDEIVVLDEMVALQSMRKKKIAPRQNEKQPLVQAKYVLSKRLYSMYHTFKQYFRFLTKTTDQLDTRNTVIMYVL